jgi:hypothetical protein
MLIYIVYSKNFESNAKSLSGAIKDKWSDAKVNLMGTFGKTESFSRYQVQIDRSMLYHSDSVTDNNSIIDLIEERL